jgi:hypothetical protein
MAGQFDGGAAFSGSTCLGCHTWGRIIAAGGTHCVTYPAQDALKLLSLAGSAFHVNLLGGAGEQELLDVPTLGASKFVNGHCCSLFFGIDSCS